MKKLVLTTLACLGRDGKLLGTKKQSLIQGIALLTSLQVLCSHVKSLQLDRVSTLLCEVTLLLSDQHSQAPQRDIQQSCLLRPDLPQSRGLVRDDLN